MKKTNVLIAGGSGMLGRALSQVLAKSEKVNVSASYFSQPLSALSGVVLKRFDFTDYDNCLEACHGIDVCVLCAAVSTGAADRAKSPTATLLPNLKIIAGLFESCAINGVKKIVFLSSSTVYQVDQKPMRESDLDLSSDVYSSYQGVGNQYRYLESLAKFYQKTYGIVIDIIRLSNVYGPYDKFDSRAPVIPSLIKKACLEDEIRVLGCGTEVRDFVYVEDVAELIANIILTKANVGILNMGSGREESVRDVAFTLSSLTSKRVVFAGNTLPAIPYRQLSLARLVEFFPHYKPTSLEQGLAETLNWLKLRKGGVQ